MAWSLASASSASGWDGTIVSDIPAGASLSSSAAIEVAAGLVFDHLAGVTTPRLELARACQRAEREWVGMECGIMDQMSVAMSRAGHALLIDCRTLEHRHVPVPERATFVVLDTTTRRALTESPYNDRRAACERAARHLGVTALRDLDLADLEAHRDTLDPEDLRRARHVVTENARVLAAVDALHDGDTVRLGELMTASHVSLRDDFASTSPELDAIVDAAIGAPGCHGARVTGAGFAGCAVALVDSTAADEFTESVARDYESATGIVPRLFPCSAADGATLDVP